MSILCKLQQQIDALQAQIDALEPFSCDDLAACADQINDVVVHPAPDLACISPVVVGELEGVDSPLNLNAIALTPVTWGGWQSQDNAVVTVSGNDITINGSGITAVHVTASVLMQNVDGGAIGNAQRAHTEVWLMRNGVKWAAALHTYMRDYNGHDASSANVDRWDMNPAGAVYSLAVVRDSIASAGTGQSASGTIEPVGDELETVSYLQAAAFREVAQCTPAERERVAFSDIDGVSATVEANLHAADILNFDDIDAATDAELLAVPAVGAKTVAVLRKASAASNG